MQRAPLSSSYALDCLPQAQQKYSAVPAGQHFDVKARFRVSPNTPGSLAGNVSVRMLSHVNLHAGPTTLGGCRATASSLTAHTIVAAPSRLRLALDRYGRFVFSVPRTNPAR